MPVIMRNWLRSPNSRSVTLTARPSRAPDAGRGCVVREAGVAGGAGEAMLAVAFGKASASPAPNQNLVGRRAGELEIAPVRGVNAADHHKTIRVRTTLGPKRS